MKGLIEISFLKNLKTQNLIGIDEINFQKNLKISNTMGISHKIKIAAQSFGLLLCAASCSYFSKREGKPLAKGLSKKSSLTRTIRDVPFFPINRSRFRLSELSDKKAFVIVMRSLDCPLSPSEKRALAALESRWEPQGVKFIYNYVDLSWRAKQDQGGSVLKKQAIIKRIEEDIKKLEVKGAYVWDRRLDIAQALMAKAASAVFVLTPARQVIYRGPLTQSQPEGPNRLMGLKKNSLLVEKNLNGKRLKSLVVSKEGGLAQGAPKLPEMFFPWEGVLNSLLSGQSLAPLGLPVSSCPLPAIEEALYEQAGPVIFKKCTTCHNPKGRGYMDFISYEDVARRGAMFEYVIKKGLMPLWHLAPDTGPWQNDLSLTAYEKALLLKWAEGGFRRKDKKKDILRELWRKSQKKPPEEEGDFDYIVRMPEPVKVPAGFRSKMFEDYKIFIIPSRLKEDKWVKDLKIRLFPKILHHIDFFILDPSLGKKELDRISNDHRAVFKNSLAYFVNHFGFPQSNKQDGAAESVGVLLPKRSHFIMSIHYENPGPAVTDDQTHVKIAFHKKKPDRKIVFYNLNNQTIDIPPYQSLYKAVQIWKLKHDVSLVAFAPHMHYRGKAVDLFVVSPSGERRKLFQMDPFDVNFTKPYEWRQPIPLEKGSVLECVTWFDNSLQNRKNPDPSKRVRYGAGIDSEMSQCYFQFSIPINSPVRNRWIVFDKNPPSI